MKPVKGIFFRDFEANYIPEILEEIYKNKVYEPFLQGKSDLVMLDIGANVGLWSFYAYKYAKKLFCVEPSEEHFQCLALMLVSNEMVNAVPVKQAISNQNGKATFYHNNNTTMFSLNRAVSTGELKESEEVETITLDKFFKDNKIDHVDFMKIDVEGSEALIFGSEGFDKVKDKIDVIVGEFHTWTGLNPEQFRNYFIDRDWSFRWLNKTDATIFCAERKK